MRIVYCIQGLYITGGMERVISIKANYFVEKLGYEVHIVVTDGGQQPPFFVLHPSIKVHQLDINYITNYHSHCRHIFEFIRKKHLHRKRLNQCLKRIKPDITIFTSRREIGFQKRLTDGSIKIAESHFNQESYMKGLHVVLQRVLPQWMKQICWNRGIAAIKKLDRFITLTNEDAENWKELQNVTVIPNPITIVSDGVSSCENKKVIAIGRYETQKGLDMLLDAWKIVSDKHKDWTLHIYGDGSLREELEKQRKFLGIEDSCFLEHKVKQVGEVLKSGSLFVLSSRFEGFALVILEAMAYGLPVVSFACPCGPKDAINDGVDGFLVEPNNVEELARKISYMIENDEIRKKMGHQASINVQRFGIERVGEMWKQLFEELTKGKVTNNHN